MDALKFLEKSSKTRAAPLFVLVGDEDFLRRAAAQKLTADLLEDADPAFALTTLEGETAAWSTVKSELDTLPFLSPRRVVVIEQADPFVTNWRKQLEDYATAEGSSGVLILQVKTFPSNTKLAKLVPEAQTIQCKSPGGTKLIGWCQEQSRERHGKDLANDAAAWLVQLVGEAMGQLDSELQKLATFVGTAAKISRADVDQMVGRTREAEAFKIFDAIGNGDVGLALSILQRLFEEGDDPIKVLGAFSWQLRRLGGVSRCARTGLSISDAMTRVGVPPFARAGMEQQLRHLGRARMDRVYDWLLENDLGMKGSSQLPPKMQLERLVVMLARKETAPRAPVTQMDQPRLAVTMGDVAGIGPEIIARGWSGLLKAGWPVVIGDAHWLEKAVRSVGASLSVQPVTSISEAKPSTHTIPCLQVETANLSQVQIGKVSAAAGQAAYDYLVVAIDLAMAQSIDAIVTCPLHKEGLHAANLLFPGHTEILAQHTGATRHAMLLFADDLAVLHVTLHVSLRDALPLITTPGIIDAVELLHQLLPRLIGREPRISVCALNPHASDGGLFGHEEAMIIQPAVEKCQAAGINVVGPLPADALWAQAAAGAYDGVVAMYHDQGHIPMKMRFGRKLVNITAGLPIIRTSVAHGTAYDIAGQGRADASSLIAAAEVAAKLARTHS